MTLHAALAIRMPDMALAHNEATAMAEAMLRVEAHYDIAPSAKTQAIIGLCGTAWAIYAPKIGSLVAKAQSRQQQARERAGAIHRFRDRPPPEAGPQAPPQSYGANAGILPTGQPDGGKIDFGT
jgi:hypothetical protein